MAKRSRSGGARQGNEARPQTEASLGHLEDCWDEPPPLPCSRSDGERLQGAWASTDGRRRVAFLVAGNHFAIHFADGEIYIGTFELEPASRPKTMVVRIEEGPTRHRGQTALCIYEFDGDDLRWCTAGPGRADRPAVFAEGDPNYLCLVFQRDRR
jgi:uncharacterized protein (TIGR03067 family)